MNRRMWVTRLTGLIGFAVASSGLVSGPFANVASLLATPAHADVLSERWLVASPKPFAWGGKSLLLDDAPTSTQLVGVAVVAVGDAVDLAWPLAQSLYRTGLRPRMSESKARILAGEPADPKGPKELIELSTLRNKLDVRDEILVKLVLAEIAKQTSVRFLVVCSRVVAPSHVPPVVDRTDPTTPNPAEPGKTEAPLEEVRVFDVLEGRLEATRYRADRTAKEPWSTLTTTLQLRLGPASKQPFDLSRGDVRPIQSGKSVLSSPWFWTALAAAAALGVTAIVLTRNTDAPVEGVRITWK